MATRGQRRHKVRLENPAGQVPDGDGGYTEAWTVLSPTQGLFAEIKPATARDLERVFAGTVLSSASHVVTTDYVPGVTTKTRVVFGTREFAIVGAPQNPDERNETLILPCSEVVA